MDDSTLEYKTYNELWENEYRHNYVFQDWKNIVKRKQNVSILINGPTRTGKSTVALTISEAMDRVFYENPEIVKKRYVYSSEEFTNLVQKDLDPGSVICYEEVGSEISGLKSKLFYDPISMAINDTLQVIGKQGLIVIFTTPDQILLSSDARRLCKFYIETNDDGLDASTYENSVLIQRIRRSPKRNKIYYPNYIIDGKKVIKWTFYPPFNRRLIDVYEEYSDQRKDIIMSLSDKKVEYEKQQRQKDYVSPRYLAKEILKYRDKYLTPYGNNKLKLRVGLVSADYNVGDRIIKKARDIAIYEIQKEAAQIGKI